MENEDKAVRVNFTLNHNECPRFNINNKPIPGQYIRQTQFRKLSALSTKINVKMQN